MDQGRIISRAWEITWNNRALWGLGFLAALAGGGGGGTGNFNPDSLGVDANNPDDILDAFRGTPIGQMIDGDTAAIAAVAGIAVLVILILLALGIVFWILGTTARAGLISSVVELEHGEKITFGNAFRQGWKHIWRLFLLKLLEFALIFLPTMLVVGVFAAIGFMAEAPAVAVLAVPLVCIFAIAAFLLQFADAFAFRGIVLKNMGPVEALRHGWSLFKANAGDVLILAVIYTVIMMVVGFIAAAVLGVFALLSASPLLSFFVTGEVSGAAVVAAILGGTVATVLGAFIMSIFVAWQSTGFTLAYLEMNGEAVEIKEKDPKDFPGADMEFI